jgi:hypothetical protein
MVKAFFEVLAVVLSKVIENNLFGLHLFTVVQFIVLTFFFKNCFKVFNIKMKYVIILGIGLCIIVANSLFIEPINTFNSNTRFLVEFYMIISCIFLFVLLIRNRDYDQDYMQAPVTFISTLFLEAAGSMIFYLYGNKILEMDIFYADILFAIRFGINFIILVLISYGLYQIFKKSYTLNVHKP